MPVRVLGSQAGGRPLGFSPPPHSTSVLSSPHLRADRQHHWAPADVTNCASLGQGCRAGSSNLSVLVGCPPSTGGGGGAPLLLQPQTPALWLRVMPGSWSTDGDGGPVPTPILLPLYMQKLPLVCSASPQYSASALLGWHPPVPGRSPGNELPQIVSRYLKPVAGCFPTLGDWMRADGCVSPSRLTINKLHLSAHQRCFLQWLLQADLCQLRGSQSLGCTHPSVPSPCSCPDEEEGPFSEAEEEKTRAVRLRDFQGEGRGSQSPPHP